MLGMPVMPREEMGSRVGENWAGVSAPLTLTQQPTKLGDFQNKADVCF